MMNAQDVIKVVGYVGRHENCTAEDLRNEFPEIKNLSCLLEALSEGIKLEEGFALKQECGRFYLGPKSDLGGQI